MKALLFLVLLTGCAVGVDPVDADVTQSAPTNGYVPSPTTEPPTERPGCHPNTIYNIGGELVVVPGYCHQRQLKRPTIGDPDPSFGWEDVSEWVENEDG